MQHLQFFTTSFKPINAAFIFKYWILKQKNIIFVLNIAWRLMSSVRFLYSKLGIEVLEFVNGMLKWARTIYVYRYWKVQVYWKFKYINISQFASESLNIIEYSLLYYSFRKQFCEKPFLSRVCCARGVHMSINRWDKQKFHWIKYRT